MFDIDSLWSPKFRIRSQDAVATFGSCFAQHFGRALQARHFNWLITEQAPPFLGAESAKRFNYGVFTARTGNIYTATLLSQWVSWALGLNAMPDEVWERDGRFFDPFRPNIEPNGFADPDELRASRLCLLEAFQAGIRKADVFVFTLGLTESWWNSALGYEYPMCPGTVAGTFDGEAHRFFNQDYSTISEALVNAIGAIREANPAIRLLLTVSPVPLTATMSGQHVLVATMESKSILRAVAGATARQFDFVDYFPSYEIINSSPFRGTFFEPNQRSVNAAGVAHVMKTFFECQEASYGVDTQKAADPVSPKTARVRRWAKRQQARDDVVCEEELLAAFNR